MKKRMELVEVFAVTALCLAALWVFGCAEIDMARMVGAQDAPNLVTDAVASAQ